MFIKRLIRAFSNSKLEAGSSKLEKEVQRQELEQITRIQETMTKRLEKLEGDLEKAVSGYRQMLIGDNPEILPEMINGRNIDELDGSLKTAKELTEKIKAKLEQKLTAQKVPGGAPVRTAPDTSNLSSYEKIVYGLEKG